MAPKPLQTMSYDQEPSLPPPPPPRPLPLSPRKPTANNVKPRVSSFVIGAPPPPPPGPPPKASPRLNTPSSPNSSQEENLSGGMSSPQAQLSKSIMEERRRLAYSIYNPDMGAGFVNKDDTLVLTDESSAEDFEKSSLDEKLNLSMEQDENHWETSMVSTPVRVNDFVKAKETSASKEPKSSKSTKSALAGSNKKGEKHGGRKIQNTEEKKPKEKKGFFKKFLGRKDKGTPKTKNKRDDKGKSPGRSKNAKSGQSDKSGFKSAQVVVQREPTRSTKEPAGASFTGPSPRALEPGGVLLRGTKPAEEQLRTLTEDEIAESFSPPRFDSFPPTSSDYEDASGMKYQSEEWSVGDVSEMTDPSFFPGHMKSSPRAMTSFMENSEERATLYGDPRSSAFDKNLYSPEIADDNDFVFAGQLDDSSVETPPSPVARRTTSLSIDTSPTSSPAKIPTTSQQSNAPSSLHAKVGCRKPGRASTARGMNAPSKKTSFPRAEKSSSHGSLNCKLDSTFVLAGLAAKARKRKQLIAQGKATYTVPSGWKKPAPHSPLSATSPYFIDDKDTNDPIHRAGRLILTKAAVPIQTEIRRFLAQREAVDRLWAIVELQSYFRRWRSEAYLYAHSSSVVKIQALYRGWLGRDKADDMRFCAVEIQRVIRGYIGSLRVYDRLYRIMLIQAVMRRALARERFQHMLYVRDDRSATSIQSAWRCYSSQMVYQFDVVDIIIVQAVARLWLAKRRFAVLKVQGCSPIEYASARTIQAAWRGFKVYTDYIFSVADILIVQRTARSWLAVREVNGLRRVKSATSIQASWRSYKAQMMLLNSLVNIIMVQAIARRFIAKRKYREKVVANRPDSRAAVKIQSAWRGFWGFSHYIILRYEVVKVQALWRGFTARRVSFLKLGCSILLQAVARGYITNQTLRDNGTERLLLDAAVESFRQRTAARNLQRKFRTVSSVSKENAAALIIQRFFCMVKYEVDREVRRHEKKSKRSRRKRSKKEPDGAMLERAWLNTTASKLNAKSTGRNKGKKLKRDGKDSHGKPAPSSVLMRADEDALSDVTFTTAAARAPPAARRSTLNGKQLHEDLSLEEAWIDAEIRQAKDQRRYDEAYMQRYGLKAPVYHGSAHRGRPGDMHINAHTHPRVLPRNRGHHYPVSMAPGAMGPPRHHDIGPPPPARAHYNDGAPYRYESSTGIPEPFEHAPSAYCDPSAVSGPGYYPTREGSPRHAPYNEEFYGEYDQEYYQVHHSRPHGYSRPPPQGNERRYHNGRITGMV